MPSDVPLRAYRLAQAAIALGSVSLGAVVYCLKMHYGA